MEGTITPRSRGIYTNNAVTIQLVEIDGGLYTGSTDNVITKGDVRRKADPGMSYS